MPKNKKKNNQKQTPKPLQLSQVVPIRGKGDYFEDIRKIVANAVKPAIKSALSTGGAGLGAYFGNQVGLGSQGSALGRSAGEKLSKLIGSGDYALQDSMPARNSLMKPTKADLGYAQFRTSHNSVRVCHREYLGDVFTSATAGAFNITSYPVNPGMAVTFPYLSTIAQNFEEYKFHGLVFTAHSTSSPYLSTSAMGAWIGAMEYNAANPAFVSKTEMENSDFGISDRFDRNWILGIECADNAVDHYYVRASASSLPLTTTDLGTMYVATQPATGYPANSNVGELWVTYDVEFFRPRVSPARFGYYHLTGTSGGTGIATGNFWSYGYTVNAYGTLSNAEVTTNTATQITITLNNAIPGDIYLVLYSSISGSAATVTNGGQSTTQMNAFNNLGKASGEDQVNQSFGNNATAPATFISATFYTVNSTLAATPPTISFTPATLSASSSTAGDIILIDMANGLAASAW